MTGSGGPAAPSPPRLPGCHKSEIGPRSRGIRSCIITHSEAIIEHFIRRLLQKRAPQRRPALPRPPTTADNFNSRLESFLTAVRSPLTSLPADCF